MFANQPAIANQVVDHCAESGSGDLEFGRQLALGRDRLTYRSGLDQPKQVLARPISLSQAACHENPSFGVPEGLVLYAAQCSGGW
jgi:hypothetical protein